MGLLMSDAARLEGVRRETRARIEAAREGLREIASRLDDLLLENSRDLEPNERPDLEFVDLARRIYKARRLRDRCITASIFADPAWDMLLDLYIASFEDRRVRTTGACHGAQVPVTTGLRWLDKLQKNGLVSRHGSASDLRLTHVALTSLGRDQMSQFLSRLLDAEHLIGVEVV
jgi:hypothetical protein